MIVGAGLGRTGTNSLKLALERLLGAPCYHLKDLYYRRNVDVAKWMEIEEHFDKEGKLDKALCDAFFRGYSAVLDHPMCVYYEALLEIYPDAKVILTTRNPELWLAGCRSTILPRDLFESRPWTFYFIRKVLGLKPLLDMFLNSWHRAFGSDVDLTHDTAVLNGFLAWTDRVKQTVPKESLLVYDVSSGWEPLCRFLNCPVPDEEFPHLNESRELRRYIRLERKSSKLLRWIIPVVFVSFIAALVYYIFS